MQSHMAPFAKKSFSHHFGRHLEFMCKLQNASLRKSSRFSDFDKIYGMQGMHSYLAVFSPKSFPTIYGGYLEFLQKTENGFISETAQDRAILMKFLAHSVYAEIFCTFF